MIPYYYLVRERRLRWGIFKFLKCSNSQLLPIFLLDQLNEGDKGVIIYTIRFHYSQVKELERALKEGLGPQMLMK